MSGQSSRSDLYAVLGVPSDASQGLIDHAYRTLVRRYHPDSRAATDAGQASSDDSHLGHVMAAYRIVGNPERRADYDRRSPNSSSRSGSVPVRVHTRATNDGALVTAGPAYWSPSPSSRPKPPPDIPQDAFSRASRAEGETPQTPSRDHSPNHRGAAGISADNANSARDVSELVEALTAEVNQLRLARDSNRRIGMAMGIVMNRLHINDEQAFGELRRTSQNTNRKLRDVAEDVILGRQT